MISVIHYANLPATTLATQSEAAVGNGSKHVTLSYSAPAKLCLHRDESRALRRMHVCVSIFSFLLFFYFCIVIVCAFSRLYYYDDGYDKVLFTFLRFYFSVTITTAK